MTTVHEPSAACSTPPSRATPQLPRRSGERRNHRTRDGARDAQAWVPAATQGDGYATNRLLVSLRPAIVRYCRARISPWETSAGNVDDIVQEVCIAVLRALPRYHPDESRPFLGFVYGIAAHKIADSRREAARNRAYATADLPEVIDQRPGPEDFAISLPRRARIAALLDTLPAGHRRVLLLRFVLGLSAAETAAAIGSTPGAVRVAQHRALTKIRAVIADQDECEIDPDRENGRAVPLDRNGPVTQPTTVLPSATRTVVGQYGPPWCTRTGLVVDGARTRSRIRAERSELA